MQEQEQPTTKKKMKKKNFRKRSASAFEDGDDQPQVDEDEALDQQQTRMALEEVKFLQRQRQRKSGIPALTNNASTTEASASASASDTQHNRNRNQNQNQSHKYNSSSSSIKKMADSNATDPADLDKDKDKDDLVLQDTFAQETAVMVEDPNMLKYVEQELAKKRGRRLDAAAAPPHQLDNIDLKNAEDELYKIPDHLKVKKRNSEESSTQWTTGIAEVQLPIEFKLRNIEETEAAKKLLQEKRLMGRSKSEFSIPSSYSADYFQRGRDYAEKLRREHPELYKDTSSQDKAGASRQNDTGTDAAVQRQAATDEFMLERFRKRERLRIMRR